MRNQFYIILYILIIRLSTKDYKHIKIFKCEYNENTLLRPRQFFS